MAKKRRWAILPSFPRSRRPGSFGRPACSSPPPSSVRPEPKTHFFEISSSFLKCCPLPLTLALHAPHPIDGPLSSKNAIFSHAFLSIVILYNLVFLPAFGPSWTPWGWCWRGRTGCCSRSWWRESGTATRQTPTASKTIIRGFKLGHDQKLFHFVGNFSIAKKYGCCFCWCGSLWQSRKGKKCSFVCEIKKPRWLSYF